MKTGTIIATAVATMMLAGGTAQAKGKKKAEKTDKAAAAASVHCFGLNTCSGQGSCKSANNACKGQNSCSGAGWSAAASEKACQDKGGRLTAQADAPKADAPKTADKAEAKPADKK